MIYLLLGILSSALVSIVMRLSTGHVKNNMTMFMANYAVCIILSLLFGLRMDPDAFADGALFSVGAGLVSGIMYLASFMLLQTNIRRNGVVLSATFMKLGVIVPTVMAVVLFHETPGATAVAGIVLAILAILLINKNPETDSRDGNRQFTLLLILLAAGGFTDSLSNIYEKCGSASLKDLYLICTFAAACLLSAALKVYRKQRITRADLGWGALIGFPNYFSARFLLYALSRLPATVVYPVYNIGAIALVTVAGLIIFREQLNRRKWIAMGLIALSLFLLNI